MSFKDTQSYKELQADWRWIHSMDPEAAAAADQWVKEHPEERKELEHMLYYSEANFHKRVAPDTLEDVDIKQPIHMTEQRLAVFPVADDDAALPAPIVTLSHHAVTGRSSFCHVFHFL